MQHDRARMRYLVYSPPEPGLPYLSVIFVPGDEDPAVAAFDTEEEAEAFNRHASMSLSGEDEAES